MSHRKFEGMWCCKVAIALEETYFIVDASGMVDCFASRDEAFSAGSRALISIINKRIVLPKKAGPKAPEIVPALRRSDAVDIEFGFFGGYD